VSITSGQLHGAVDEEVSMGNLLSFESSHLRVRNTENRRQPTCFPWVAPYDEAVGRAAANLDASLRILVN
jgi:hypothetical protein